MYSYQSSQPFPGNYNMMQINGGYPYGYPPSMPQNSYNPMMQQPFGNVIPGVNTPMEVSMTNGTTFNIPPSGEAFNPGGMTVSKGGFNPVTGAINEPTVNRFNPYNMEITGNYTYRDPNQGFSPYYPGCSPICVSPLYNSFYANYWQNEFDKGLQEVLYQETPSSNVDVREVLRETMLPEELRKKIRREPQIIGMDYYGRPIYNNYSPYQLHLQRQQEFEKSRRAFQEYFVMLSKMAHAYHNEEIDEQAAMEFYDPVRLLGLNKDYDQQKIHNFYNSTGEERKEYERKLKYQQTSDLIQRSQRYEKEQEFIAQKKQEAFAKIKETHDKLLGIKPEEKGLTAFLENGYKLLMDAEMKKIKSAYRNGTKKYSINNYRAGLSQINNVPVPITSKDDEYVSIESRLKAIHDRNRRFYIDSVLKGSDGQLTYVSDPLPGFSSEREAHEHFLEAIQAKKEKNEIQT